LGELGLGEMGLGEMGGHQMVNIGVHLPKLLQIKTGVQFF